MSLRPEEAISALSWSYEMRPTERFLIELLLYVRLNTCLWCGSLGDPTPSAACISFFIVAAPPVRDRVDRVPFADSPAGLSDDSGDLTGRLADEEGKLDTESSGEGIEERNGDTEGECEGESVRLISFDGLTFDGLTVTTGDS